MFNFSPKIITDGLVLYLDAANPKSYAGSGTVWNDLSRGQNRGTLTNGPTFNSANGGSISFDGVDDHVNCGNVLSSLTELTLECWVRFGTQISNYNGIISKTLSNANGYELRTTGYTPTTTSIEFRYVGDVVTLGGFTATNGVWYHIVGTGRSGAQALYVNTSIIASKTEVTTPTPNTNNLSIGKLAYTTLYLNGNISIARIYNRALTAQEVQQNFNATRQRFGV
jgi:hypothetical protein